MNSSRINIAFLVNASFKLGTGNIVRCLNLAKHLNENSIFEKIFFFSTKNEFTQALITSSNFELKETPHDIQELLKFVKKEINLNQIEVLIIDIPNITESIIKKIQTCDLFVLILDTSNIKLLNFFTVIINILPKIEFANQNRNLFFQGIEYWILNPILLRKRFDYKISREVKNILVSFGTTDPINLTKRFCLTVKDHFKDFRFHVIVGPGFQDKEFFRNFCKERKNVYYYEDPEDIYELMSKVDIAFSAGGGTLFELVYIGVPTIILPNSPENLQLGNLLDNKGMALSISKILDFRDNELLEKLQFLINNYEIRKNINERCRNKFHGEGQIKIENIMIDFLKEHQKI